MEEGREQSVQHFLDLIRKSKRGKFKIYIGMSAGVGKTYRMLTEAHNMLKNGIDIQIGYIETHSRKETAALLEGLPMIPRRKVFYKGDHQSPSRDSYRRRACSHQRTRKQTRKTVARRTRYSRCRYQRYQRRQHSTYRKHQHRGANNNRYRSYRACTG
jgi:hypothetical protein